MLFVTEGLWVVRELKVPWGLETIPFEINKILEGDLFPEGVWFTFWYY